jgi:hypothetical protein
MLRRPSDLPGEPASGTEPPFGIFDHIEDILGTATSQLFKDRLGLIEMADEAGFAGYYDDRPRGAPAGA